MFTYELTMFLQHYGGALLAVPRWHDTGYDGERRWEDDYYCYLLGKERKTANFYSNLTRKRNVLSRLLPLTHFTFPFGLNAMRVIQLLVELHLSHSS